MADVSAAITSATTLCAAQFSMRQKKNGKMEMMRKQRREYAAARFSQFSVGNSK